MFVIITSLHIISYVKVRIKQCVNEYEFYAFPFKLLCYIVSKFCEFQPVEKCSKKNKEPFNMCNILCVTKFYCLNITKY
jgi:hypothetical protein